jgi:hypothetical protein
MAGNIDGLVTCDAFIKTVEDNIVAKFSALDTEYGDSITLTTIQDYRFGPLIEHPDYPAMVVVNENTDEPDETKGEDLFIQQIVARIIDIGDEPQKSWTSPVGVTRNLLPMEYLGLRLKRMARGVIEIIRDNNQLTISSTVYTDMIFFESAQLDDILVDADDETYFRQDILLSFRAQVTL